MTSDELRQAPSQVEQAVAIEATNLVPEINTIVRRMAFTIDRLTSENERLKNNERVLKDEWHSALNREAVFREKSDFLQKRVADLELDIRKYRQTISVCSGSCSDHHGSIWDEMEGK